MATSWEEDHANRPTPEGWPLQVKPVYMDDLDHLGMDKEGNLYWQGKRLKTATTLDLTTWQAVLAGAAAIAAVLMALIEVLRFFGIGH